MKRLGIIIQREYLQIVGKKSFIFTTLLLPILMLALCIFLPVALANVKSSETKTVAVAADPVAQHYADRLTNTDEYEFVNVGKAMTSTEMLEYYQANKESLSLYAVVYLPDSMARTGCFTIYSDQSVAGSLERAVETELVEVMEEERIKSYGIEGLDEIMRQCSVSMNVKSVKWNESGDEQLSSAVVGEIIGFALSFLTYMFVLLYGAMIMNGVIEEKTNRIVEVIVSSCRPMELMLGKIIGVALVGFTQIIIWSAMLFIASIVLGVSFGVTQLGGDLSSVGDVATVAASTPAIEPGSIQEIYQMVMSVNYAQIFGFFLVYFVGGYLLYASLFAAFGSAVDQPSDASQFMSPIIMVMLFAFYAGMFSIENPDGPLAWWCSLIPFTSPIVMMIRLPYDVPVWELILSIAILFGSAFGILYLAGRIYRTGILMYGKKVSFKEILKWIK